MICNSGGSKSRLAKAAGAEPSGQLRDEKLLAVVVKMLKTQHCQSIFWKFRCRKVHAVVARIRFKSQPVKNTAASEHVWKLRC